MPITITAKFPARREVELAIEHLVQEYGIERTDIFVEPAGKQNSSGQAPAGADAESGHPGTLVDAEGSAYEGQLVVSVDMNEDEFDAVEAALRDAGALDITAA